MDKAKGKPDGTPTPNKPLASSYDPMEVIQMMRSENCVILKTTTVLLGRTSQYGV